MNSEKKKAAILGRRTGFERESELPMSTIDKTADELNRLHQSILTAGKNMVRFAIEAGEILFVKKNELNMESLSHGLKRISILKYAPFNGI
ncbi:hypothetical protein [Leptospira mayottensis]|uniref:hypothetical protein n=1 Tax=Leptospira mayottensis TaxID=1137606 RepID=UPI0020B10CA3|nr:hypothetical protein [Leptospira mayottensis]